MKRGSAWGLTVVAVGVALLFLVAPVSPQSPSLTEDDFLTEVDVANAPLTVQTADHQVLTHGFGALTRDWQAPDLKVCAQESVKAGAPHPATCSQICYYQHDCKAVLNPPLALSSETASVRVQIQEPDMPSQGFMAADITVGNVGMFTTTPYIISGQTGFQVTFVINVSHKKTVGLATSAVKAVKKYLDTGKIPLPPLLGLGDVQEGAANAYNLSVQNYNMCLNAKASQYNLASQADHCRQYINADYGSCMADVLANNDHQDVVVAPAPEGCGEKVGQAVIDTETQVAKAALCRWANYAAAFFGTQACTSGTSAANATPPYSPFQNCMMGAIYGMRQLDPAGPNLIQEADQKCNATLAPTQGRWEYCMQGVLAGPTACAAALEKETAAQHASADAVHNRNFYFESNQRLGICLNVRAKQDPKWNPAQ